MAKTAKRRGPPLKLTDAQWADFLRLHLKGGPGSSIADLADKFGIHESTAYEKLGKKIKEQKVLASQIATVETALEALPMRDQVSVRVLVDHLKSVSGHLAHAAKLSSETALRLASIAHVQSSALDPSKPMADERDAKTGELVEAGNASTLQSVAMFTAASNEASKIGLNLLAANNKNNLVVGDSIPDAHPDSIPSDPIEASRAYQRIMGGGK